MDPLDLVLVFREGILAVGVVAAPVMLAGFVAAGGMGLLQSSMNLHDPAIGLAPRLLVVGAVLFLTVSWMVERLSEYLVTSLGP